MQSAAIQSAETMAALRALAARDRGLAVPCRDSYAVHFLGRRNKLLFHFAPSAMLRAMLHGVAPGGYAYAIARTRHFDEALLRAVRSGIEQVVILGAGYDSRALRFRKELEAVRVFELDLPGTQARKMAKLARSGKRAGDNVIFAGVDFARQSFRDVLAENGFRSDRKTLFLWEGVSYYLPEAAVAEVLSFVGKCAPGSSIVFDYALATFVAGDASTYGGEQIARWLKRINEQFLFGMNPADAPSFLEKHNLATVSHVGPADLERLYLTRVDDRSPGRTLGHLRIIEGEARRN